MLEKNSGNEIRRAFLDYFAEKGHREVRSSNLVPAADPTLLFTNAGMVQFKDVFLGREARDYKRAASSQKCLRVSGKHNDLEEVGRTNRHNTFFEMLGNFSFGDYFKEGAIEYAWEFLTVNMGLPREKLWVTVFEEDSDAAAIWEKVAGVSPDRIVRLGEKDNFWSMGPTGPCGPCSEIHIDNGAQRGCGKPDCGPGCDCDRYEELWNLVFMQFDRSQAGELTPLPDPSIDTGMGLERLASVLQGVESNFDTDLIRPIIARAEDVLQKPYGSGGEDDVSLRVIGDHVRAAAFLITEGILPSNDDRGYVLRRLLRRAMRHGKMLGASEPFLYKVVGSAIDLFRGAYPELSEAEPTMAKIIKMEEQRFGRTLEAGLGLLNDVIEKTRAGGKSTVDGTEIFKLYDTYGFPLDLARDVISDAGFSFDSGEFQKEMENQRAMARKSFKGAATESVSDVYTSFGGDGSVFLGYDTTHSETSIQGLIKDEKLLETAKTGDKVEIILPETPFYAESGGQVGDKGVLVTDTGVARVLDTKKVSSLHIHFAEVREGEIRKGQNVSARVDSDFREAVIRNHSATHLLQSALRAVLGDHVKQSGSLVDAERLRFDFSHYAATTLDEIREAEDIVNRKIREDIHIASSEMDLEEAMDSGATALFGEKYASRVRVVAVPGFSRELCGGTHSESTGQIGLFKIVSETGVAAGTRRIEAITGRKAFEYVLELEDRGREIAALLKGRPEESPVKVRKLIEKTRELEKEIKKLREEKARGADAGSADERDIKGVKVISRLLTGIDAGALRNYVDEVKAKAGSCVVLAATVDSGKVLLASGVTKDLMDRVHAGKIIKEAATVVGGGGGGRPDMAQAGGTRTDKVEEALQSVFACVEKMLG